MQTVRASGRRAQGLWLAGVLACVAVMGLPSLLYPFHPDHAMFAVIGDRWLHGGLPYRDAWDVKPPGVYAVYALAQAVFGRGMAAVRWADLIATLAACAGLYAIARRRLSAAGAVLAPLLFGLVYFTCFEFQDSAQAESFAAPLVVVCVLALLRAREGGSAAWPLAAGLALGAAALLKTTFLLYAPLALFLLPAGGPGRLPGGRRWHDAAWLAAGVIAPLALTAAYFAAQGAFGSLVELLAAQRAYATLPRLDMLGRSARCTYRFFRDRSFLDLLVVLSAISLARPGLRRLQPAWLWAWLALAAGMVAVQWRAHSYHFLVLLPPLSLLAATVLAEGWRQARSSARPLVRSAGLACALLLLLAPIAMGMRRYGLAMQALSGAISRSEYWGCFAAPGWYPFINSATVADYVRRHSAPHDPVLVFDYDPAIYYLSERLSPTRHLSSEPIVGDEHYPAAVRERWRVEQLREVAAHPPRLLVVGVCPYCSGMAHEHTFAPPRVRFAGIPYRLLTCITKDRIYGRVEAPAAAIRTAGSRRGHG